MTRSKINLDLQLYVSAGKPGIKYKGPTYHFIQF